MFTKDTTPKAALREIKEEAQEIAHEAGAKARRFYDVASHETRDATAAVTKEIRQNPLAAGAIAAGIGFLVGALFSRRR